MADLVSALAELGDALDGGRADAVVDRLFVAQGAGAGGSSPAALAGRRTRLPLRWAVAAAVAAGLLLTAAWPPARRAVADLLGIGAVDISAEPFEPGTLDGSWASGLQPATPAQAAAHAGVEVGRLDPERFGEPAAVLITEPGLGRAAVLVYAAGDALPEAAAPGVGALLTTTRGELVLGKLLGSAGYEQVAVGGSTGVWISGPAHEVFWFDDEGQFQRDTARLAGNTLVWQKGDVTYRLESALDRDAAIAAAEQLR